MLGVTTSALADQSAPQNAAIIVGRLRAISARFHRTSSVTRQDSTATPLRDLVPSPRSTRQRADGRCCTRNPPSLVLVSLRPIPSSSRSAAAKGFIRSPPRSLLCRRRCPIAVRFTRPSSGVDGTLSELSSLNLDVLVADVWGVELSHFGESPFGLTKVFTSLFLLFLFLPLEDLERFD
ncbi:hypothetical protein AAHA92_00192 [Salvia divinorum]|uniref:Uncharacterized protein n=1 Tax=Salvia divinorum TaxID=28513 RepID=A0ABD1IIP6_SALDI